MARFRVKSGAMGVFGASNREQPGDGI